MASLIKKCNQLESIELGGDFIIYGTFPKDALKYLENLEIIWKILRAKLLVLISKLKLLLISFTQMSWLFVMIKQIMNFTQNTQSLLLKYYQNQHVEQMKHSN